MAFTRVHPPRPIRPPRPTRRLPRSTRTLAAASLLAVLVSGCSTASDTTPKRNAAPVAAKPSFEKPIVIGYSADDTNTILARTYGTALDDAGYNVHYRTLPTTNDLAYEFALEEIDLYVTTTDDFEFNNTAFFSEGAARDQRGEPTERVTYTDASGTVRSWARDGYVLAVKNSGDVYTNTTLSNFRAADKAKPLVFGATAGCIDPHSEAYERRDLERHEAAQCAETLEAVYDRDLDVVELAEDEIVAALNAGTIDVARLRTTDPAIGSSGLLTLADPERVLEDDYTVAVYDTWLDKQDAGIGRTLDKVSDNLTTYQVRAARARLNHTLSYPGCASDYNCVDEAKTATVNELLAAIREK